MVFRLWRAPDLKLEQQQLLGGADIEGAYLKDNRLGGRIKWRE
jgi:hypothetical protein